MKDGFFIPWDGAERAERRTLLQERLEGQQISMVHFIDEPGPTGSCGLAFELTTGAKLIVFGTRDQNSQWSARLAMRWLPRPLILLPRLERVWSGGRSRNPLADPPNDFQKLVEGEVVRGVISHREPHPDNRGEWLEIETRSGMRVGLCASVIEKVSKGERLIADVVYWITTPERTNVVIG